MSKSAQPIAKMIAQALEQRIIEGLHEQAVPLWQAGLALEFGTRHIPMREGSIRPRQPLTAVLLSCC